MLVNPIRSITQNGLNARKELIVMIAKIMLNAKKEPDLLKLTLILIVLIIRKK